MKQTDFNGEYSYSNTLAINRDSEGDDPLSIYPNPAINKISVEGSAQDLENISILNALGQDVTKHVAIVENQELKSTLDLSNLKSGIYFVITNTKSKRHFIPNFMRSFISSKPLSSEYLK